MKRVAALMLAGLLLAPVGASAATTLSNPQSLRAILPDPVDGSWIEVVPGRSGYIDGPVTYDVLRAYYTYYQQTYSYIQHAIDILQQGGFVAGYERQWLRVDRSEQLSELIYVFGTNSGALRFDATSSRDNTAMSDSTTSFDTTLGVDATGTIETLGGATFTSVDFIRGNAFYDVDVGSNHVGIPAEVIPQARVLHNTAPLSIALSHTSSASVLTKNRGLVAVVGLTLLLGMVILAAAVTVAVLLPHRRFFPRQGAPLGT